LLEKEERNSAIVMIFPVIS